MQDEALLGAAREPEECDFILRNPEMGYAYVQVAMTIMADRSTEEREYRPFEQIRDNCPKYLLTRSDPIQQRDGIVHANIPEFMQEGGSSERDGDWLLTSGATDSGVGFK